MDQDLLGWFHLPMRDAYRQIKRDRQCQTIIYDINIRRMHTKFSQIDEVRTFLQCFCRRF